MIRKYILKYFEKLLDITCIIAIVGVLIASFSAAMIPGWNGNSFSFTSFLITLLGGGCAIVISYGVLYLLFDIRDELKKANASKNI